MRRILTVLFAMGFIIAVIFGGMASAYLVAGLADEYLFVGASHLSNILFLMLIFVMVIATLLTLAERKWSAMMQDRVGPNRARLNIPGLRNASLAGIPHIVTDVLKMLTKEDFIPAAANRLLYNLGPVLAFAPVFALFAVVPAGPTVSVLGHRVEMVVTNPDFGVLYLFAIASLAVYGTSLAGWSSNNKFALLGGVRASSQMISYEVALGLSLVGMMIAFSTVQMPKLGDGQAMYLWRTGGAFDFGLPAWGIFLQPVGFFLFFAAAFAETKRAPFDVPEGESEIIGYFVEYSGMKFGMFMISEFVEVVVLSGVTTVLFFGSYHLPFGEEYLSQFSIFRENGWVWGALLGTVFWIKVILLVYVQLAIRWTFPRFRYDQIQTLGWKILLPAGLVNLFLSGALILWDPSLRALALVGLLEIGIVLALAMSRGGASEEEHGDGHGHGAHGHGHGNALAPGHAAALAHEPAHASSHAAPASSTSH
jgi:NADH-quinone oxidoreductase subunit H